MNDSAVPTKSTSSKCSAAKSNDFISLSIPEKAGGAALVRMCRTGNAYVGSRVLRNYVASRVPYPSRVWKSFPACLKNTFDQNRFGAKND